ncbi:circadian-associated transcriptional repressor-like protein [Labeo rohita]|uniref:Circadian-associated transcriptional repressor-like protein n=1 Tax=Labeo rohita TaxID=84645 RepID=A0A498M204_LABRO|nr:circadian-associated transcriptional repressor-like protein [Labeo rohita]
MNGEQEPPGSQWAYDGFNVSSDPERSEDNTHPRSTFSSISSVLSLSSSSSSVLGWNSSGSEQGKNGGIEGDLLFARKCLELQGYVRPLLELLNGLKKGRFDKGLSSFQQSVAMDRIQRIVGVLQKPHIGERYLPTLLQIEMMLKLWFPQVTAQGSVTPIIADFSPQNISTHGSSNITPPHKHKDQLHIPVKKRRLSWSDTDSPSSSPHVVCKRSKLECCEEQHRWPYVDGGEGTSETSPLSSNTNQSDKQFRETPEHKIIRWSGAAGNFIDQEFAAQLGIETEVLSQPLTITAKILHLRTPLLDVSSYPTPYARKYSSGGTTPLWQDTRESRGPLPSSPGRFGGGR